MSLTSWPGAGDFLKIWGEEGGRACLPRRFWSVSCARTAGRTGRAGERKLEVFGHPWRRPNAGEGSRRGSESKGARVLQLGVAASRSLQPCCSRALPAARSRSLRTGRQEPSCCLRLPTAQPAARSGGQHLVPAKACQESACERARAVHGLGSCNTSAALRCEVCSGLLTFKSQQRVRKGFELYFYAQ